MIDIKNRVGGVIKTVDADTLSSAGLSRAYLSGADLSRANLSGADLSGADLSGADLSRADLSEANLSGADLSGAYLFGVYLFGVDLSGADLSRADLSGADLSRAYLFGATGIEAAAAKTRILPEGDLIGYKRGASRENIRLRIPAAAKRSHAFGRKCRAEYAEVLEILDCGGNPVDTARSSYDSDFVYRVGLTVRPRTAFNDNWMVECASGIHFFITRIEAQEY